MLRVYQFARTSTKLKELSLVLDSMIRSSKALLYLAGVMGVVYWSAGAWARGILQSNGTLDLLDEEWVDEYWGQSLKAAFTMFQPLVMQARSGGDHGAYVRNLEDKEAIGEIRTHFEQSLLMQDRNFIDYQELRDAMTIPEIMGAIRHLELPVSDALTLFEHVDVMQTGRITLDELMESIKSLTSKATPFDTCCLTARIGGTATFTTRLVTRTDIVAATLEDVRYKLRLGIDELTRASIEDEELTQVPEVFLRKSGHINHYKESSTVRYTG
ncbi:unnamed protein product [Symbiodinium microadriaticum]|nr:unnamed protein product [Symbiodinium microadriaticum]